MPRLSARARLNAEWIEKYLRVPDGKFVGHPVKLSPEQLAWLQKIYGSPTRSFYLSIPRKNGKTTFAAMLVLLHLVGPEFRRNSQIYSAARSRDQAAIVFELAAKMVRMSPDLESFVKVGDTRKEMKVQELGTFYKALSADAKTKFGLSPALIVHDELGQVEGPEDALFEALETACAAQEDPLTVVISTQAPSAADLFSTLLDDALTGADPTIKAVVYSVPEKANVFDIKEVAKAQPHWHLMNQAEVKSQLESARRLPSREPKFRNLVANQRTEQEAPFISRMTWEDNAAAPRPLAGQVVYGGLDLSAVSDLTALVLATEDGDVHPTFWLPEEGLREKSEKDRTPWDVWAKKGFLETTPGRAIEYRYVAQHLRRVFSEHNVAALAFDRFAMKFLRPYLVEVGFTETELEKFIPFGQGFVSMSPALRELEARLLARRMRHGAHPVLTLCARNAVVKSDPAGNRKLDKSKRTRRIDGMVSLAMAIGAMPSAVETPEPQLLFV